MSTPFGGLKRRRAPGLETRSDACGATDADHYGPAMDPDHPADEFEAVG
jgi:hypothetical protein